MGYAPFLIAVPQSLSEKSIIPFRSSKLVASFPIQLKALSLQRERSLALLIKRAAVTAQSGQLSAPYN